MSLRFIHLSDIHFSNRKPDIGFDPDKDVRNELRRDLATQMQQRGATAILVSGDIAYSGKKVEYDDATAWLDELCEVCKCAPSSVIVCPGNHDIDQSVLRANSLIEDSHANIRREDKHADRDTALNKRLLQPEVRNMFYAPLREFNEFAARYECSFFADEESYAWDKDFVLNDESILRLRGMNSALLSGLSDREGSLFLGSRAWTMPRHDGVEYLSICHHPPSWLLDRREARDGIDARARIQLFGHEHDQRIDPGQHSVRLFAGAVNPHRA